MSSVDLIKTFIEYHLDMSHRVWESIDQITAEQFISDDDYSRGSIRNLMVHLVSAIRWTLLRLIIGLIIWYRFQKALRQNKLQGAT